MTKTRRCEILVVLLATAACVGAPRRAGDGDGEPAVPGGSSGDDAAVPTTGTVFERTAPLAPTGEDDRDRPQPIREAPGAWVRIDPGTFVMGSPADEVCHVSTNDGAHQVTITHPFEIQTTETTQEQYRTLVGEDPSSFQQTCGDDCPVEMTDWHAAARYCNALSELTALPTCYACGQDGGRFRCVESADPADCAGYRLPTEAEWEYAYRAGTTTPIYAGTLTECGSRDPTLDTIAWYLYDGEGHTHPVATKAPNAWGLFDMSGNVWEWTGDGYVTDLAALDSVDPFTPEVADDLRVMRGGSYNCLPGENRAAHRSGLPSVITGQNVGFRCARGL